MQRPPSSGPSRQESVGLGSAQAQERKFGTDISNTSSSEAASEERTVCIPYAKTGFCSNANCKREHLYAFGGKLNLICKFWAKDGGCKYGEGCIFQHPTSNDGTTNKPTRVSSFKSFLSREISTLQQAEAKLDTLYADTLANLNRDLTLTSSDHAYQRCILLHAHRYLRASYPLVEAKCDDSGNYQLTRTNDLPEQGDVPVTYSIFDPTKPPEDWKTGSAKYGRQRIEQQVSRVLDLNKRSAIFTEISKAMEVVESNAQLSRIVESLCSFCPYFMTIRPRGRREAVMRLDETTMSSLFAGTPYRVLEDMLFLGSDMLRSIIRLPPKDAHAALVNALDGVQEILNPFTWRHMTSCLRDDMDGLTDIATDSMMNAMFHCPTGKYKFQQQFVYFELLWSRPDLADTYVDVCRTNPFHEKIKALAVRSRGTLEQLSINEISDDEMQLILSLFIQPLQQLEEFNMTGAELYEFQRQECGSHDRLGAGTYKMIQRKIQEVEESGKKTLIYLEKILKEALEHTNKVQHDLWFNTSTLTGYFVRPDGERAGILFQLSVHVIVAVSHSFHIINSPTIRTSTRLSLCGDLLCIKAVLGEAGLQAHEDVSQVFRNLKGYALDLEWCDRIGRDVHAAIKRNSANGLCFGHPQKKGVEALAHWICKALGIKGCNVVAMGVFIMHLGHDGFVKMMKLLGCKHDCSDMEALLKKIERERKDLGKMSEKQRASIAASLTGRERSDEHSANIRAALTGRTGRKLSEKSRAKLGESNVAAHKRKRTAKLEGMRKAGETIIKIRSEHCPPGHDREVSEEEYFKIENKGLHCLVCKTMRRKWRRQE